MSVEIIIVETKGGRSRENRGESDQEIVATGCWQGGTARMSIKSKKVETPTGGNTQDHTEKDLRHFCVAVSKELKVHEEESYLCCCK